MLTNPQLALDVMSLIEAEPELHDQGGYAEFIDPPVEVPDVGVCGVSHCFAGHAINMAGHTFDLNDEGRYVLDGEIVGHREIIAMADHVLFDRPLDAGPNDSWQNGGWAGKHGFLYESGHTRRELRRLVTELVAEAHEAGAQ